MSDPLPTHNGGLLKQMMLGMVIALFGAAIGFGISQLGVGVAVEKNKTEIDFLRQAHLEIRKELVIERGANEKRVSGLSDLLEKQIDLNKEIIGMVRDSKERR